MLQGLKQVTSDMKAGKENHLEEILRVIHYFGHTFHFSNSLLPLSVALFLKMLTHLSAKLIIFSECIDYLKNNQA